MNYLSNKKCVPVSNLAHREMQGHKDSPVHIPNLVTGGKWSASVSTSRQAPLQF